MRELGFKAAEILLPQGVDMEKWSVVACDQFTSQPEYWRSVEKFVGDAPSTLHMVLPEIYLEEDTASRVCALNAAMEGYVTQGLFQSHTGYIYLKRRQRDGALRHGIVGVIDLERYEYTPGVKSLVRATEGTVLERIPPRVAVRENAALELPHVMLLINDPENTVIAPLAHKTGEMDKLYDFPLMQDSGAAEGYLVDADTTAQIESALAALADKQNTAPGEDPFLFAVGDGNHSLATAKTCYENLKETLSTEEAASHPARYALVEVVNLFDSSLQFEPIHRTLFDIHEGHFLVDLRKIAQPGTGEQQFVLHRGSGAEVWHFTETSSALTVGTLQNMIDAYLGQHSGAVDYIHGDDVAEELAGKPGNLSILLPAIQKDDFFAAIDRDGVLPRKTFSMGHAWDKRFYLECRKIR